MQNNLPFPLNSREAGDSSVFQWDFRFPLIWREVEQYLDYHDFMPLVPE